MVGLTDQPLSCAARAHVVTAERNAACLHLRRAMRAACRRASCAERRVRPLAVFRRLNCEDLRAATSRRSRCGRYW